LKTHHLVAIACAATSLAMSASAQRESSEDHSIGDKAIVETNPLLMEWNVPFGVPPFSDLKDEHYLPALRATIAEHNTEVKALAASQESPTFANTIEALEASGRRLGRVTRVFFSLEAAHSNDALREVARVIAPELSAHADDVLLDAELFARVKVVYDKRGELQLGPEQARLLEETHKAFVRAGVNLSTENQDRLRVINAELATLSQKFGQNLLAETNDFELHLTSPEDIAGLPDTLVAAAAEEAKRRGHESGWSFTLSRPSINPFLQYSPRRDLRKVLFDGYALRGDNDNDHDNKTSLSKMAALRAERAALLGYRTHAHYVLSDNMAETPERVYELLDQVWKPALRVAKAERAALQEMMRDDGIEAELKGWDWRHYTEKVRKARYDYDEEATRPYFEVSAVREGVFILAHRLFGLTFTERQDLPTWHPDQQAFEVKEGDRHVGILYLDFFMRESKSGGAWMASLQSQSRLGGEVQAIVTTNFNFPPPTDAAPSLLSFREAQTLFHEVGHALHGLLSDVTYESLSGTNVPRDFVEFPSQVMENWMSEPEVLRLYAKHYMTGEVIPDTLIAKIKASERYNQGFATLEYMAAAYLDMAWHTLEAPTLQDARAFEAAEMERIGLIDEIVPRYRSNTFAHVFSGGYSAGYYSYLWSEVLDADAFEAFKERGLFDTETARRYRRLLSQGGTKPGMVLYEEFRGRAPVIEPLLERRGLIDEAPAAQATEQAP
jgi:peptidyl-dipeptidase Dcp